MKRLLGVLAVVGVVLGAVVGAIAPPVSGQAPTLEITQVDASNFPLVRAAVAGPSVTGDLDTAFVVTENGEPVTASAVRLRVDELNVVVAVDVSGSMAGEPLDQAKAAVGALLENLPDNVPVAVVAFGPTVVDVHPFTTDHASVRAAVSGLIAAGETALYDGIARAASHLGARPGRGAVVVLADGADSASGLDAAGVVERLAGTDLDTTLVALQSPDLDLGSFESLADGTGARLVTVDEASALGAEFAAIGAGLSSAYELRWRSTSTGSAAEVSIALAGSPEVRAVTTFEHDEVRQFVPDVADRTYFAEGSSGPLASSWFPYVAAAALSAGAVLLLSMLRGSDAATERREERRRSREATKAARQRRKTGVQERLESFSAQVLESNNRGRSLDDRLDRAGLAMRSNEFVVVCAAVVLGSLVVGVLLFGIPYFLLATILPALGIPLFLKFKTRRRSKKFGDQLADTLQLMAGSLTAGYGLGQALDSVARETDAPTSIEFQRVVMETRLGRSLEDALDAMSQRLDVKDFDWVVDAIKIQSSVGGNLSEIIGQVGETIRSRNRVKRQVDALTAEGKISALVLFCLPFGLMGFIFTSNPSYLTPMFSSGMGQVMLGAAIAMLAVGGLWLKKLVNPEF